MKKKILIALCTVLLLSFASCDKDKEFDSNLLVGKWIGQISKVDDYDTYYRFDGYMHDFRMPDSRETIQANGCTWCEHDDVFESEAQPYTWSLDGDVLLFEHHMEMGASVPKSYTVTELTSTTLVFEDVFGNISTLNKVN